MAISQMVAYLVLAFSAASLCSGAPAALPFQGCPFLPRADGVGWFCCPDRTVSWEGGAVVGVRLYVTAPCRGVLAQLATPGTSSPKSAPVVLPSPSFSDFSRAWWFWLAVSLVSFFVVFPFCYLFLTRRCCALQNAELYNVRQVDDSPAASMIVSQL